MINTNHIAQLLFLKDEVAQALSNVFPKYDPESSYDIPDNYGFIPEEIFRYLLTQDTEKLKLMLFEILTQVFWATEFIVHHSNLYFERQDKLQIALEVNNWGLLFDSVFTYEYVSTCLRALNGEDVQKSFGRLHEMAEIRHGQRFWLVEVTDRASDIIEDNHESNLPLEELRAHARELDHLKMVEDEYRGEFTRQQAIWAGNSFSLQ